jgi:hypothetical protein
MKNSSVKYGVSIAVIMIAYFWILKLIGLHQYPVFSAMNGVFIGGGIFYAMRDFKRKSKVFEYSAGFKFGLLTGVVATIVFGVFMAVYIFQIDTVWAHSILDSWGLNYNKGGLALIISLFIMGFATTFVLTLSFMQLLKESWNQKSS